MTRAARSTEECVWSDIDAQVEEEIHRLGAAVLDALAHLKRLVQMEFWNFFPMAPDDPKDLLANNSDILPYLREAILKCRALGRFTEAKNFPECMLADLGVSSVRLISNNPAKADGLESNGIEVAEMVPIDVAHTPESQAYLDSKRARLNHLG